MMRKSLVLIVIVLFICCSSPDPVEQADALEQELETVLDGGDATFDHIDIEEGSDAAVIRGEIASLELEMTLIELGLDEIMISAEADYAVESINAEESGREIPDKLEWVDQRYDELAKERIQREAGSIRARLEGLRNG